MRSNLTPAQKAEYIRKVRSKAGKMRTKRKYKASLISLAKARAKQAADREELKRLRATALVEERARLAMGN